VSPLPRRSRTVGNWLSIGARRKREQHPCGYRGYGRELSADGIFGKQARRIPRRTRLDARRVSARTGGRPNPASRNRFWEAPPVAAVTGRLKATNRARHWAMLAQATTTRTYRRWCGLHRPSFPGQRAVKIATTLHTCSIPVLSRFGQGATREWPAHLPGTIHLTSGCRAQ